MYSSYTLISRMTSYDVICRYMVGYLGVRIPDAVTLQYKPKICLVYAKIFMFFNQLCFY